MKKIWIAIGIGALIGILYYGGGGVRPGVPSAGKESMSGRWQAPNFELTDMKGNPLSLSALRGKVVLLDFWATWCPPCVAEIPHFKELHTQYKGRGFEIVGLSLDEGGEEAVRSFAEKHQLQYPIAPAKHQIAQAYGGIQGIPTTFLIDKKGYVAKKYIGYHDKKDFEQEIQKLLSE